MQEIAAFDESCAIPRIQIGLCGQPFGQHHIVAVELDMPVFDVGTRYLRDRGAIDQHYRGNQYSVHQNRVAGSTTIALGLMLRHGPGLNSDRPRCLRIRMAVAIDAPMAQPTHGPKCAGGGSDKVSDGQTLNGDFATVRHDKRSGAIARQSKSLAVSAAPLLKTLMSKLTTPLVAVSTLTLMVFPSVIV